MLTCLLVIWPLLGGDVDVRAIPPDERIAYANKLCNRIRGRNAKKHYTRANKAFVHFFMLSMEEKDEQRRNAINDVEDNISTLALCAQWSKRDRAVLDQWLTASEDALVSLRKAGRLRRFSWPIKDRNARLHEAVSDETAALVQFRRLARLMAIKSNQQAIDGAWDEAYAWNLRVHRMAGHLYQNPWAFGQLTALSIEPGACDQLLSLMHRHYPDDAAVVLEHVARDDGSRFPDDLIEELDALFTWDYLEAWHEWADDPDEHPNLSEMAELFFKGDGPFAELEGLDLPSILGERRFDSVAAFRKAIQAVSIDKEWAVTRRAVERSRRWHAQPFHIASRNVESFDKDYCGILDGAPSVSAFGCGSLNSSQGRLRSEWAAMHRGALTCVVAIHEYREKHDRWPAHLDDLAPKFIAATPIDPFSGDPFVYKVDKDEKGFVLYSIGSDQKNDGGQHVESMHKPGDHVFWPPPVPTRDPD